MYTHTHRDHHVPPMQLQRWLDDGGALGREAAEADPTPVTWSPPALRARLEAERALRALPRRTRGVPAEARTRIRRIVAMVEERRLPLRAATTQLQAVAARLREYRRAVEASRRPCDWQLLSLAYAPGA